MDGKYSHKKYPCLSYFFPTTSMHMLPKSHKSGFYKHESGTEFHIGYGMVDRPKPEEVCDTVHIHDMILYMCHACTTKSHDPY